MDNLKFSFSKFLIEKGFRESQKNVFDKNYSYYFKFSIQIEKEMVYFLPIKVSSVIKPVKIPKNYKDAENLLNNIESIIL
ncbi:TPA: hypothetical protein JRX78_002682 [Elizabethkingia anophelis]|uniref:hypothetical protein n=1 Tax=Elizabethkingia anophelis TaxID=1117645 RepID=UPI00389148FB|nr:hypothetical protein [Elizabethkingia anophelis]HAY3504286.1 hypothetical protein [Elizabethkingia anophelis]HAY3516515.1 hypothetical protein [Elizabethkingia anophelis]